MLISNGSVKMNVNNDVHEDSSWHLQSLTDDEINMKLNLNGKKYEIREFTLDDLGNMLTAPHTTEEIKIDEFPKHETLSLTPYPNYSYKQSLCNRKSKTKINTKSNTKTNTKTNAKRTSKNKKKKNSRKRKSTGKASCSKNKTKKIYSNILSSGKHKKMMSSKSPKSPKSPKYSVNKDTLY